MFEGQNYNLEKDQKIILESSQKDRGIQRNKRSNKTAP